MQWERGLVVSNMRNVNDGDSDSVDDGDDKCENVDNDWW